MNLEEIFSYHAPTAEQLPKLQAIREGALAFARVVEANMPPCADRTVAIRKIGEASMTANRGIILDGRF